MIIQVASLKSLSQEASDKEKKIIEELSFGVEQGADTIERMIEIGQKMIAPAYERLTLESLILSSLKKSERKYAALKVTVNPPRVPKNYFVRIDPSLIGIAFTNLLDNAFKYMRDRERRMLTIAAEAGSGDVEVTTTIEDTGEGMSEEKLRLIFTEFPMVNGRVSVGVMIARLILGLHGGRLSYTSVEGDGTKTIIALPLDYMEE
jgi:K+-sensing histidine kinase KdpD